MTIHDIFLSHSGEQKGFAKDLYKELSRYFSTFFDIAFHSLPPGEPFPARIFAAAKSCKLALVLLSEEYFVRSKWPMMELSTFVEAADASAGGSLKLLPLFFNLSPLDLKSKPNLERWKESWKTFAMQDGKNRIDVSSWERALETLRSQNGVIFDRASGGEQTYIDHIMQAVCRIVRPAFKFFATYISGKDRLCEVILDKFVDMEREHNQMLSHKKTPAGSRNKVSSVLGLYGLLGSGKTTLCKCLADHFWRSYGPKVLHLEYPSTPTYADKVKQLKKLLQLTDFRDRVCLDDVSHVQEVEHLLQICHFSSCRVFLVVDNISDNSWEEVCRILRLGVGDGSKVILVARTLSVLCPILHSAKSGSHKNWVCDSMPVPSINESEATEILLQTYRDSSVALDKNSPRQLETVQRIVRMCSFNDSKRFPERRVQLPLLIKAVGARLQKYSIEKLGGWESDMERLLKNVETHKQTAVVEELVGENFKALLNEHLQLMFLDVALFILQIDLNIEAVSSFLSMMHGYDSDRIKMKIKDLERHCFLEISALGDITIHDVYLEFAEGIRYGPSKYIVGTSISCSWDYVSIPDATKAYELRPLKENCESRTLILKGGNNCERVNLQGLSGLKAVALMNCKSLVVLGLAGLSSLSILEIRDCAMYSGRLDCHDNDADSLVHLKRLYISTSRLEGKRNALALSHAQTWQQVSYLQSFANVIKSNFFAPKSIFFAAFRQPVWLEQLSKMRNLQILHLINTGTSRLELNSCSWPQLRSLTVIERYLERFALGNFPSLSQFVFADSSYYRQVQLRFYDKDVFAIKSHIFWYDKIGGLYKLTEAWRHKEGKSRFLLAGKDLLTGCPQLRILRMESAFFKQGQLGFLPAGLETFQLHFFYTATELPDLSLSADSLECLDVGYCEQLESVNLLVEFKSLKTLILQCCHNLVEVTGLGRLPSLRYLSVSKCQKLQQLTGFDSANHLHSLVLKDLQELRQTSWLSSFKNLVELRVKDCPRLRSQVAMSDLSELEKLASCEVEVCGQCRWSLRNCKSLWMLRLVFHGRANGTDKLELGDLENLKSLTNLDISGKVDSSDAVLDQTPKRLGLSSIVVGVAPNRLPGSQLEEVSRDCLPVIQFLTLSNLDVLDNMDGIEYLCNLRKLELLGLRSLRSLQGLGSLRHINILKVCNCPLLKELSSLQAMVHMRTLFIQHCPKLKAVEGCDFLKKLRFMEFDGCEAMERCPLTDDHLRYSYKTHWADEEYQPFWLSVRGCEFASNVEAMTAWASEPHGRVASLWALVWEYYHPHFIVSANDAVNNHKQLVKEALLPRVADLIAALQGMAAGRWLRGKVSKYVLALPKQVRGDLFVFQFLDNRHVTSLLSDASFYEELKDFYDTMRP